jgi:hypothetical protein
MGILDDAIREHLELKRSHGASDDEIRRKEAEAFGPQRQAATADAPVDEPTRLISPDADAGAEAPLGVEPLEAAPEDPYEVHPGDDLVPDADSPHAAEPEPPAPPVVHEDEPPHPALDDHRHLPGEEHPPEPVFRQATEEPPPPAPTPLDEHTVEYSIEEAEAAAAEEEESPREISEEEDEDVLEETPEFLQDAPEHDRLWFEQKPPRDFDFGE